MSRLHLSSVVMLIVVATPAAPALAQVTVVEEHEVPTTQVVEQGYVRGQGRGIQYGAHVISPVYLSTVVPSNGSRIDTSAGLGLLARVGWEFPSGLTLEVQGGFAVNAVDRPNGFDEMSSLFTRAEVGGGARYMFFNDTAFVPFIQAGGSFRWFWFDYVDGAGNVQTVRSDMTGAVHGALGAQIELSPYFGIEAGVAVDYTFWGSVFADGFVSIMPFLGVTLYVEDSTGN